MTVQDFHQNMLNLLIPYQYKITGATSSINGKYYKFDAALDGTSFGVSIRDKLVDTEEAMKEVVANIIENHRRTYPGEHT